jgi:hypothetical protein
MQDLRVKVLYLYFLLLLHEDITHRNRVVVHLLQHYYPDPVMHSMQSSSLFSITNKFTPKLQKPRKCRLRQKSFCSSGVMEGDRALSP